MSAVDIGVLVGIGAVLFFAGINLGRVFNRPKEGGILVAKAKAKPIQVRVIYCYLDKHRGVDQTKGIEEKMWAVPRHGDTLGLFASEAESRDLPNGHYTIDAVYHYPAGDGWTPEVLARLGQRDSSCSLSL